MDTFMKVLNKNQANWTASEASSYLAEYFGTPECKAKFFKKFILKGYMPTLVDTDLALSILEEQKLHLESYQDEHNTTWNPAGIHQIFHAKSVGSNLDNYVKQLNFLDKQIKAIILLKEPPKQVHKMSIARIVSTVYPTIQEVKKVVKKKTLRLQKI